MHEIHDILVALAKRDINHWLVTVIDVQGSSYRKKGALLLLAEDGTSVGMISGGCIEADIKAQLPFITTAQTFVYDLYSEEEESWGRGAGCNGKITVLLEYVSAQFKTDLLKVKKYLEVGKAVLSKRGEINHNWEYVFIVEDHLIGTKEVADLDSYEQIFHPKPRLVIFGAGDDAIPLCELASKVGFRIIVCDQREAYCSPIRFPKADRHIIDFPTRTMSRLSLGDNDFVVVMTHIFQLDQEIASAVFEQTVAYLGFLGPRERTERLYAGKIPTGVHTPIGLSIGAQGPVEIAVSVIAELVSIYRKRMKSI